MVRHGNAAPRSPSWRARCDGHRQGGVAPAQGVRDGVGCDVGEHRQHVGLGVPEAVPVIAGPGQALGGDRPALGPGPGLQHVEQREPHRLLDLGVPVELARRPGPRTRRGRPAARPAARPTGLDGPGQRRVGLVANRGQRPGTRPAVGDELDQPQPLPGLQRRGHRHPTQVFEALGRHRRCRAARRRRGPSPRRPQATVPGGVHQTGPRTPGGVRLVDQGRLERGGHPRIPAGGGELLVGDQLGLHDHPRSGGRGPPRRSRSPRSSAAPATPSGSRTPVTAQPGRGHPLGAAVQHPGPEIQAPLMGAQLVRSVISNGSSLTSSRISLPLVTLTTVCPDSGIPVARAPHTAAGAARRHR